jgi:pSer/pThr/pTyr-binding forkhead associated (FHA) protein
VSFDPDHDDLASRRHARIVWDTASPSGFSIEDLVSSNGTYVDGRRISGRAFLQSGLAMGWLQPVFDEYRKRGMTADADRVLRAYAEKGRKALKPTYWVTM